MTESKRLETVPSGGLHPPALSLARSVIQQINLALGIKGVGWATAAGLLGMLCCGIAFADIAWSLRQTDIAYHRRNAGGILALDDSYRQLLREVLGLSNMSDPSHKSEQLRDQWQSFLQTLTTVCGQTGSHEPKRVLGDLCARQQAYLMPLREATLALADERRPLAPSVRSELIGIRDRLNALSTEATRGLDQLFEQMIGEHQRGLVVLFVSTTGFVAAGLVLILLIGHASVRYHSQSREASEAARQVDRMRLEYETLVGSLSDMVFKLDVSTGRFLFVNAAAHEIFAVPVEQLVGSRALDHVAPEDVRKVLAAARFKRSSMDRSLGELRFRVITGSGEMRHVEGRFRSQPDGRFITGILRDVEGQVQLALRLGAERTRLRSIVESSGALVLLVDPHLRIVMVNREFTDLTGFDNESAVGWPMLELVDWPMERDTFSEWFSRSWTEAKPDAIQFTWHHRDRLGNDRIFGVTAKPILNEAGAVRQVVFLGVDETARREVEQALADSARLALAGELAGAVAHEVAQPLQIISLASHTALEELNEPLSGEAADLPFIRSKLERIIQNVERGNRIVGEMRAFVRGGTPDDGRPFDPMEAVRGAIELTSHAMAQAHVDLSVQLEDELPPVFGHVGKLEQVVVNLLNNARDAGGSTVFLTAASERRDDGRISVRIMVQDDGPGIDAMVLDRIFHAFVTTKPHGKGTGLGLRICRRIVEDMGGTVTGSNRAEGGARFEVLLPAIPGDQPSTLPE